MNGSEQSNAFQLLLMCYLCFYCTIGTENQSEQNRLYHCVGDSSEVRGSGDQPFSCLFPPINYQVRVLF